MKNPDNLNFVGMGKKIRELRLSKNMTQQQLAEKAGIKHASYISKIESGNAALKSIAFIRICLVLDAEADELARILKLNSKIKKQVLHKQHLFFYTNLTSYLSKRVLS